MLKYHWFVHDHFCCNYIMTDNHTFVFADFTITLTVDFCLLNTILSMSDFDLHVNLKRIREKGAPDLAM